MLTSPQHYDKGNNQFWRNMFEYVYEQTAEKAAAMDDDSFGLWHPLPWELILQVREMALWK